MADYSRIPQELRALRQWVCVGNHKMPINPHTGQPADVTDPATWSDFETASARSNGSGIGFVFQPSDPYTFIDLDAPENETQRARHTSIYQHFQSYTELSRSGNGVHIIVRGKVPSGARRDKVEVYPHGRYAIMTGHVLNDLPITDQQPLLNLLYEDMRRGQAQEIQLQQVEGLLSDEDILRMAENASNGDKFAQLCRGEWKEMGYPSQSEADFALLSMFAFYTSDNEQCRRLFRYSALGKRAKAQKNDQYLDRALRKIRSNEPPPVDLSGFKVVTGEVGAVAERGKAPAHEAVTHDPTGETGVDAAAPVQAPDLNIERVPAPSLPPGLMGAVADYIYKSAVYPVPEVAIAGAIGFLAGVCGRAYNVSKTGLNQYVILLAPTGSGKDAAAAGIDRLFGEIRRQVPAADTFIGPGVFASGQAILRTLEKKPCQVSVLGEFGFTLQAISAPTATTSEQMMRRVLLDLYTKSGHGRALDESAYSDREKNTQKIFSPSLSILGESTQSRFYDGLTTSIVEEGLVPRFLILDSMYEGTVRNREAGFAPDPQLIQALQQMAFTSLSVQQNNTVCHVQTSAEGQAVLDTFEARCNRERKGSGRGSDKELWSRAYLKAVKLAALVAVGCNPQQPVISEVDAAWAVDIVVRGTHAVTLRFDAGAVGGGESQFEHEILSALERYHVMRPAQKLNSKCPKDCVNHPVIPYAYLWDQLKRKACFVNARMGMHRAVDVALEAALQNGILVELAPSQRASLGIRSKCYVPGSFVG